MKKQIILGSFLALAGISTAQWAGPGVTNTTGVIYRTGDVGIGTSTQPLLAKLDVQNPISLPSNGASYLGLSSIIWEVSPTALGANFVLTAIKGRAAAAHQGDGFLIGTTGVAEDGFVNYGGEFTATSQFGTNGTSYNFGVRGTSIGDPWDGNYGGYFRAIGNAGWNVGIHAEASGDPTGGTNTGVFGSATGNPVNGNIGGFFQYSLSSNSSNDWAVVSNGDSHTIGGGTWQNSDRKLKDNIKPITDALEKIILLKPTTYTFKTKEFKGMNLPETEQIGLIAQDLELVFPTLVRQVQKIEQKNEKGETIVSIPEHKTVNYTSLIPVLIAGIQEQQKLIEDLQTRLTASENKTDNATGINQMNSVVDGFAMDQNIPNPFSNETVIKYTLTEQTKTAVLNVYDLSGKQITSFPLTEKGSSSITITSEKLAAGIYIYSIVADGKIMDSKRMVVAEK